MKLRVFAQASLLAFVVHGAVHAAPFTNGDFESGNFNQALGSNSGNDYGFPWLNSSAAVPTSANLVTGWVPLAGKDFSWHDMTGQIYIEGRNKVIDLNGDNMGGLQQTFDTVAGHVYRVDFFASRHFNVGTATNFIVSAANGASSVASQSVVVPVTISLTNGDLQHWQPGTLTFTATGASTTLAFTSTDAGTATSTFLDGVSVTDLGAEVVAQPVAVPLGGAWSLLGLSAMLLSAAGWRRRSRT